MKENKLELVDSVFDELSIDLKRLESSPTLLKIALEKTFEKYLMYNKLCDVKADFQKRAKVFGEAFEDFLEYVLRKFVLQDIENIELIREYEIPEACMVGVGAADFAVLKEGALKMVIEAKGSAHQYSCKGKVVELSRPGLIRTDTMKKALANAVQLKFGIKGNIKYVIITSHKPESGNSKCIMDISLRSGLVDAVLLATDFKDLIKLREML
ncbi:hypothetical protein IPA_02920 [Ignicoccus pacificus DSM 13166]|uniref:Uncharacterized protein n=1 Tax=Ignicoccus pacificus DSM 13166 TaxID=940294 RepID=A0A977KCN4_9CREN|nr:hypothetical protein IPA_02920 [Ignicoccus pacificus DSM 13166]